MKMQPLLIVQLVEGKQIVINEAHVMFVEQGEGDVAILTMSDGQKLIAVSPPYGAWVDDAHGRK